MITRRHVVAALGCGIASGGMAGAQVGPKFRIGVFAASSANRLMGPAYEAFVQELLRSGFDSKTLTIEHRSSEQHPTELLQQARDIVDGRADLLVALGAEPSLHACVQASSSVPIVFVANNYDPIARGYVKGLRNPGGRITGVFLRQTELAEKQVELLAQALPASKRIAIMWDYISADQQEAASKRAGLLGLEVIRSEMKNPPYDLDAAYERLKQEGAEMLLALTSPFFALQRDRIVDLAIIKRIATMFIFKGYVQAGGLMSYGADPAAMYRQGAVLASKILRGARPDELPVEQPTKFEMAVNLKTAKILGIEVPTGILLRADDIIE